MDINAFFDSNIGKSYYALFWAVTIAHVFSIPILDDISTWKFTLIYIGCLLVGAVASYFLYMNG